MTFLNSIPLRLEKEEFMLKGENMEEVIGMQVTFMLEIIKLQNYIFLANYEHFFS